MVVKAFQSPFKACLSSCLRKRRCLLPNTLEFHLTCDAISCDYTTHFHETGPWAAVSARVVQSLEKSTESAACVARLVISTQTLSGMPCTVDRLPKCPVLSIRFGTGVARLIIQCL